jgi:hypothetical protein
MVAERSERLPWLHEVPRSAPAVTHRPRHKRRLAGQLAGVALLLAGIGGGAYWLGTRDGQTQSQETSPAAGPVSVDVPQATRPQAAPETPAAPILPVPVAEAPPPPIEQVIAEPPEKDLAKVVPEVTQPELPAPKLSSRVRERLKQVRADAKRDEVSEPVRRAIARPAPRRFALVPPGPPGRVVQLGSFTDIPVAQENWRAVAKRWPYLTTKTRILSPIWMRQENGWRLYYRLQLGAASQAQSVVICQRLQKAGQPCVVVY